jgi:hypothetical protein
MILAKALDSSWRETKWEKSLSWAG